MAYGKVPPPLKELSLDARFYKLPERAVTEARAGVLVWPIDCSSSASSQGRQALPASLQDLLHRSFDAELEKGITYPQRAPMSAQEFAAYFCSYDLVVGVFLNVTQAERLLGGGGETRLDSISSTSGYKVDLPNDLPAFLNQDTTTTVQPTAGDAFDWNLHYAFSYYIKPNYPGRSSHLCNAGFIVPAQSRGLGIGGIAGKSFLYYGPRCGYRGSVFNLVYANNEASVRIWDRLGFYKVGRIPQAGLLRRADGQGEEYVDAWVIHGDFEKLVQQNADIL